MKNEDSLTVYAIEDPTRRLNDLSVTRATRQLVWSASAFRMQGELIDMREDPPYDCYSRLAILNGDVVRNRVEICECGFRPDYFSHLASRSFASSCETRRSSATAISPRAIPSRIAIRSCCRR